MLRELLVEPMCLTEQAVSGEHLDGRTEKTLKQMAVQLRGELRHFLQANSSSQPHDELKSPWGTQPVKAGGPSKLELKDASVQTVATEGNSLRFKHEGRREAWEETLTDATLSAEHQPESLSGMPGQPATSLPSPSRTDKVSVFIRDLSAAYIQTKNLKSPLFPLLVLIYIKSGVSLCLHLSWPLPRGGVRPNLPKSLTFSPSFPPSPSSPVLFIYHDIWEFSFYK